MSSTNNSHTSSNFDYWEFVHCAVCFLPFVPNPENPAVPPVMPFWLTECGHTVCNNHLNADQSCASCGAPSIQLIPLGRDMPPPMSEWFRSINQDLDSLSHAAGFQQENMASLVRFHKQKSSQQNAKLKKVLAEIATLRSQVAQLRHDNEQLRAAAGLAQNSRQSQSFTYGPNRHATAGAYEPGTSRNVNGKRPLADINPNQQVSSPRSIVTPLGPPRITLPPDQRLTFSSGTGGVNARDEGEVQDINARPPSRFAEYAYQPPETPLRAQPLRHQQQPQNHRQQPQLEINGSHRQVQGATHVQRQQLRPMPPPPTPVRPLGTATISQHQTSTRGHFRPAGRATMQGARNSTMQMPPPPVAREPATSGAPRPQPFPMEVPDTNTVPSVQPSSTRLPSMNEQFRTIPQTPSNRFFASRNARAGVESVPSTAQTFSSAATGGTRTPFLPNGR